MSNVNESFRLEIPLDASSIEDFKPEKPVKVVIQLSDSSTIEQIVKLDEKGQGATAFNFERNPGSLRVIVGPEDASADEMVGLQTINLDVSGRNWLEKKVVVLQPIQITPYYWHWWLTWCRSFVIRGRVVCPDGNPVPGATVCAYDIDMWWWWCSKQQVGCAVTDANGVFELKFRWCCGWWPWWWWKYRIWQLEPLLAEQIMPVLQKNLKLQRLPTPSPKPDLAIFQDFLGAQLAAPANLADTTPHALISTLAGINLGGLRQPKADIDPNVLEKLGETLKARLPAIPELDRLKLWPWWNWRPWWDCTPDIIFKVTQPCHGMDTVIVNETCWDTRWDIPTALNVTLVANELACCIPPTYTCKDGNCLALTAACQEPIDIIGGNTGALATPVGYVNPGVNSVFGDRPFAGVVRLSGTAGCMGGVDYYEFEWSDNGGATWNPMPLAAAGGFTRSYFDFATLTASDVVFTPVLLSGHNVFESLPHYEATHAPGTWGSSRYWLGSSRDLLMNWLTENNFADGTYRLRVKGWNLVGGVLVDPHVLNICETQMDNYIVLTIDNRLVGAGSGHPPSTPDHPAGPGTVHTLTLEPDTDIIAARIIHTDGSETVIGACGKIFVRDGDLFQVDFLAHDPNRHLALYTLNATYGENQVINLLALGGILTPSPIPAIVPPAAQVGPNYSLALAQGAISPYWAGGAIRLQVKAKLVFPVTCCYQLELRAHKRTIVNCDESLWGHTNYSEFSFLVEV